jgi:WD40 repeat protein
VSAPHLTLAHYRAVGGISGALSQHADEVLASLPGLETAVEQVFRALSEVDKEGRATRRALSFKQLLAETGIGEEELRRVLDRFRADDCSFILPSPATVPRLREDTRIDVVHEALLRRWNRISAATHELRDGQVETGWLAAEERDGRFYRALFALVEAAPVSGTVTLPLDQVEARWKWWKSRPRTAAWAERYGGGLSRVEKLFTDSKAALEADRQRQQDQQRREREEERRKIEADEAAKRAQLEHEAAIAAMQAEAAKRLTARTRVAAIAMSIIAIIALGVGAFAAVAWKKALADEAQTQVALQQAQSASQLAERERLSAVAALKQAQSASQRAERERLSAVAALKQAEVARQQAVDAQRRTSVALAQAEQATNQANAATKRATAATTEAVKRRAAVFLQSGREAFLSGDNDDASVLLAAAYGDDRNNASLRLVLGQALDKLSIRAGSFHAHDALITALQFDPDSNRRWIATASADDSAKLWDASGRLIHVFSDQGDLITALAFDPKGRYLATVGRDGSAKIRDLSGITLTSARAPIVLKGHPQRINSVAFNHAGTSVATSGADGKVELWKIAGGAPTQTLDAGATNVNAAAFTSDDRFVVAASSDGKIWLWDPATGKLVDGFQISTKSPLLHLAVAPTGLRVAAGAADGTVVLYDAGTHKHSELHGHRGAVNAVAFDASGSFLVSGGDDGTARIVNAATGATRATLAPSTSTSAQTTSLGPPAVLAVAFSPSGAIVATTYADGSLSLWSVNGEALARLSAHSGEATAADFASNGVLATAGNDGNVFLWHPPSSLVRANFAQSGAIDAIAFAPGGRRVVTASHDGTAVVWRLGAALTREKILQHAPKLTAWVTGADFSPDGKRIVTAGGPSVKVWSADGSSVAPLATIATTAANKRYTQAAFLGDGSGDIIASQASDLPGGGDSDHDRWSVWSQDGKRKLFEQWGWQREIDDLQLSRNGHFVLATSSTGAATFSWINGGIEYNNWNSVASGAVSNSHFFYALGLADGTIEQHSFAGQKIVQFSAHQGRVSTLAFSPDDRWLGSAGSGDLLGKIWDVQSGRLHATLTGHEGEIESIAFSPDGGAFVLTASIDGTARLWDRDTGDLLSSVSVPGSIVRKATFTPDGSAIVLGAENGGLYLWPIRGAVDAPRKTAAKVLAALKNVNVGNLRANPLVRQGLDELAASAGEQAEMVRMAGQDRTSQGLRAAMNNEPTKAAGDLLPAFLAAPNDSALHLTVSDLFARFGALRATFQADTQRIDRVVFAEGGARVVTSSFDLTAKVWDVKSGALLHVLAGFNSPVSLLSAQRYGNLAVVAALGDNAARLWDLNTGLERSRLVMGSAIVRLGFSGDGSRVVGLGADNVVRVWDSASGRQVREFHVGEAVAALRSSVDGTAVLIAGKHDAALWDVASGKRFALAIAATGDQTAISRVDLHERLPLALTVQANVVRVWDRKTGRLLRTLRSATTLSSAAFGRESDVVAGASVGGIVLWRPGSPPETLRPSGTATERLALFADHDRRIFGIGSNRSVAMWNVRSARLLGEFAGTDSDYFDADVTTDGGLLVTAGADGATHLWVTGAAVPAGVRFDQGAVVVDFQIDAAGKRLLTRSVGGLTRIWDLATMQRLWERTFQPSSGGDAQVRLTPDGRAVVVLTRATAASSAGKTPAHWLLSVADAGDGRAMRSLELSGDYSLSPSGRYVASIQGNRAELLDTLDSKRIDFAANAAQRVHFATADDVVVLEEAGHSTIARLDGSPLATLDGVSSYADAALTADGRRMLTFGPRMSATLWDVSGGRATALAILYGGGGDVTSAAFSGDGERALTVGADGRVRLWSASRGQSLGVFGGDTQRLTAARFNTDGRFIVATSEDGSVGVWDDSGTGLLSFPTRSLRSVTPRALGNFDLLAADGQSVMLYRIGRPPTAGDARSLAQRLGLAGPLASTR